jgi:hypothetical protein
MNSRWREYDYFYHTQAIQDEVAHLELAAEVKQTNKKVKGPVWNLRSLLGRTLLRLRATLAR